MRCSSDFYSKFSKDSFFRCLLRKEFSRIGGKGGMVGGRDPVAGIPWHRQYSDPSSLAAVHAAVYGSNAVVPHGAVVAPGQLGSSGGLAQLAANRSLLQNYTNAAGQHSSLHNAGEQDVQIQHARYSNLRTMLLCSLAALLCLIHTLRSLLRLPCSLSHSGAHSHCLRPQQFATAADVQVGSTMISSSAPTGPFVQPALAPGGQGTGRSQTAMQADVM